MNVPESGHPAKVTIYKTRRDSDEKFQLGVSTHGLFAQRPMGVNGRHERWSMGTNLNVFIALRGIQSADGQHEDRTAHYWKTVWLPLLVRFKIAKWKQICQRRRVTWLLLCSRTTGVTLDRDILSEISKYL